MYRQETGPGRGRRLGFAVKVVGGRPLPSHDARRWQSGPSLERSLDHLEAILLRLDALDVRMYRMSSSLAPYATHPELPQFHEQVARCCDRLAELGALARRLDIRLSSHPSQYVVLNSADERVRDAAVRDLELHADLFDAMGLGPEAVVVLHVGGTAGGRSEALTRFEAGFDRLSDRARARLALENDDRAFGVGDVLSLSERLAVPVVWDVLHHQCHDPDGLSHREALARAVATWPQGAVPKIHFSSPRTAVGERRRRVGRRVERSIAVPPLRAHADLIDPVAFEQFLDGAAAGLRFDVMLEAKAKDVALVTLREQLGARGFRWRDGRLHDRASASAPAGLAA